MGLGFGKILPGELSLGLYVFGAGWTVTDFEGRYWDRSSALWEKSS